MKNTRNYRCVQCNRVSDSEIETNAAEAMGGHFFRDPRRNAAICADCQAVHEELMADYYLDDTV